MPRKKSFRKSMCSFRGWRFKVRRLAASDEKVDGDVGAGEQASEYGGDSFQALYGLLVLQDAAFELRQAAWLAVTDHLLHLALQHGQICQDLPFKVRSEEHTSELQSLRH